MTQITPATYQKLVKDISSLYEGARKSLAQFYWGTGQRIVEVEQRGEDRAAHGSALLEKLSRDLTLSLGRGFSVKNLERMRRSYLKNPKSSTSTILNWSRQVELLSVSDSKARAHLEKRAIQEDLTSREIRSEVKKINQRTKKQSRVTSPTLLPPSKLLVPIQGRLFTYQVVKKGEALYLDRGFRNYQRLTSTQAAHYQEGAILENLPGEGLRILKTAKINELYTYEADLDRISDGDTQWYFIYTEGRDEPGMRNDKLRLRGIDCPEMNTAAGKAAKKFVEKLFSQADKIRVSTTKPDKFDRYLSDVFLKMKDGSEIFLNNELLKTGHARLYDDPKPEDWDE